MISRRQRPSFPDFRHSEVNPVSEDQYELIDFGGGRKLESLGGYLIDRPSPAAAWDSPQRPDLWARAGARYEAHRKTWVYRIPCPDLIDIDCGEFRMPIRLTPSGHIGLFPEQAANWSWLHSESVPNGHSRAALNLFGYTGASTMALVSAGYRVAHVDAAKPNVQAARAAAEHNGWDTAPIRYLVDDAAKFVARELRRERVYHTIVLDPPAYGHGPSGRAWRLDRDLWPLLNDCLRLVKPEDFRMLVTGHSPEVNEEDVQRFLERSAIPATTGLRIETGRSQLRERTGRMLDAGFYVRIFTTMGEHGNPSPTISG